MKYLKLVSGSTPADLQSSSYVPYLLSIISASLYPIAWIYCSQQKISISESAILRGLTTASVNFIFCKLTQSQVDLRSSDTVKFIIIRSIIMAMYSLVFALSQFILPLPVVHTINCSGQIFIFLLDYFLYGVKINCQQAIGVFLGIFGVLLAGNGRVIMELMDGQYVEKTDFKHYITDDIRIISGFTIVFIIAMAFFAYGAVITKKIKANAFQITLFMALATQWTGGMSYSYTTNTPSSYTKLLVAVFLTGIPLTICYTLYIAALKMTKNTGLVSLVGSSSIVISYFISIFRYNEKPNIVTNIGVVLVLIGLWRTISAKQSN